MCTIKPCFPCIQLATLLNVEIKNIEKDKILFYIGNHYTRKNAYLMEKYHIMSSNNGNTDAMFNLGRYYMRFSVVLMKKYYLMAIGKGNTTAMRSLGDYYKYFEGNYNLMLKYYLMAIDNGDSTAIKYLILICNSKYFYNKKYAEYIIILYYKFYRFYKLKNYSSDFIMTLMDIIKHRYRKYKISHYTLL